jgi:hypothetical protein
LAVVVILGAPLVLYSLAPTGPLREGDTVFSDGQQQVRLSSVATESFRHPDDTCLLDPGNPLIILQGPDHRPDGLMVAHVQGRPAVEWPFCPPQAEVLIRTNQVSQKPAVFTGMKDLLVRMFD